MLRLLNEVLDFFYFFLVIPNSKNVNTNGFICNCSRAAIGGCAGGDDVRELHLPVRQGERAHSLKDSHPLTTPLILSSSPSFLLFFWTFELLLLWIF